MSIHLLPNICITTKYEVPPPPGGINCWQNILAEESHNNSQPDIYSTPPDQKSKQLTAGQSRLTAGLAKYINITPIFTNMLCLHILDLALWSKIMDGILKIGGFITVITDKNY